MDNALVTIRCEKIGDHDQAVNARELHQFLEVGRDFNTWIKGRIDEYGFTEGQDYGVFPNSGENPQGGRPAIEYLVTLDMAKELAMVERTEKGRQVRRYFIACEKKLRQTDYYLAEMVRRDGARAMARLLKVAAKAGKKPLWLNRLLHYRNLGLTQEDTAVLMACSTTTIHRYETLLHDCGFGFTLAPAVREEVPL
jgi:phage anti-repressor protein